jgi:hypothetical protein
LPSPALRRRQVLTEERLAEVRGEIVALREGYIKTAGYTAQQLGKK